METGLTLVEAEKNAHVLALLSKSNFFTVNLSQLQHHVVICLDNDGKKTFADNLIFKAVERLDLAGKTVSLIIPERIGTDFNDILKSHGVLEVKKVMSRRICGDLLLHNSEKFKAFTGENMDEILKHAYSLKQPQKNSSVDMLNTSIKVMHKNDYPYKQLVLER